MTPVAPIFHPVSERLLDAAGATTGKGVLLTGEPGIGLTTAAKRLVGDFSGTILRVLPEKDEKVDLEKGIITIAQIRLLYDTVRTTAARGRVVLITHADRMGVPTQNAFLKLLEEPPVGTRFILLSHYPERLLPTVLSRVEQVAVRPLTGAQSEALLDTLGVQDAMLRTRLLFIASGLPAELTRLVTDEARYEARVQIVKDARVFVTGGPYDRLVLAKQYKDSRENATLLLVDAMKQLKDTVLKQGSEASLQALERLELVHTRLLEQGNVRLQLSSLGSL